MVIDISKITLENYKTYNEKIKYEVPRQWGVKNIGRINKKQYKTEKDREKYLKEYQHEYYLKVTKPKRKAMKE